MTQKVTFSENDILLAIKQRFASGHLYMNIDDVSVYLEISNDEVKAHVIWDPSKETKKQPESEGTDYPYGC
jgi:hypothetical protein